MDAQTKQDLITMSLLMRKGREMEEAKKRAAAKEDPIPVSEIKHAPLVKPLEPPRERPLTGDGVAPLVKPQKKAALADSGTFRSLLECDRDEHVLSREDLKRVRDVAELLVNLLVANGYKTFEDIIRFVSAQRPNAYGQLKDMLRRAWNCIAAPEDEISFSQGREIFAKVDAELHGQGQQDEANRPSPEEDSDVRTQATAETFEYDDEEDKYVVFVLEEVRSMLERRNMDDAAKYVSGAIAFAEKFFEDSDDGQDVESYGFTIRLSNNGESQYVRFDLNDDEMEIYSGGSIDLGNGHDSYGNTVWHISKGSHCEFTYSNVISEIEELLSCGAEFRIDC